MNIDQVKKLLLDLLRIQTPSKMEEPGIMYLKSLLREKGITNIETYYVSECSYNLVINDVPKPDIVFMVHIDTIPIIIPNPEVVGEYIVKGTGAVDTKGSLAALLSAVFSLEEIPENVSFAIVSQEETTGAGSHKYLESHRPKHGVILEPTNLSIANTHFGSLVINIKIHGEHFHPDFFYLEKEYRKKDAFLRFRQILEKLDKFSEKRNLNISILKVETIGSDYFRPLEVDLYLEMQIPPNERALYVYEDFLSFLENDKDGLEMTISDIYEPYIMSDEEFLSLLEKAYNNAFGSKLDLIDYKAWTDAMHMHSFNVKTVVFGPGDPKLAHTVREQIDVRDVLKAGKFFLELIRLFQ
ncbi:MAG: M20/M25/M40 family metallo-hydrolase [Candidatus Njordarchaeia archaeon]